MNSRHRIQVARRKLDDARYRLGLAPAGPLNGAVEELLGAVASLIGAVETINERTAPK